MRPILIQNPFGIHQKCNDESNASVTEAVEGCGLGSHEERLSARPPSLAVGFFRAGGQNPRRLESKFVVATKAVSSPSVTNALLVKLRLTDALDSDRCPKRVLREQEHAHKIRYAISETEHTSTGWY
jgi:hypothetical protein